MDIEDSVSNLMWNEFKPIGEECLNHPFLQGIYKGDLDINKYINFIGQDAFFLDVFARVYAIGVFRSTDIHTRDLFHNLQCGVFEELKLHQKVSKKYKINIKLIKPLEATTAYTEFLLSNSMIGSLGDLLSAITPCMRLYLFLGTEISKSQTQENQYSDWIEAYSSSEYIDLVNSVEGLLNVHSNNLINEKQKYKRAMNLEYDFFDQVWH